MRIVIDARALAFRGIGTYTRQLLRCLQEIDAVHTYYVLLAPNDYPSWSPTSRNFRKVLAPFSPYSWREQLQLPLLLRRLNPDLVHYLQFSCPLFGSRRHVVTIHDLTRLRFDTRHGSGWRTISYPAKATIMRAVQRRAIQTALLVIAPSHFVAHDVASYYHLAPAKLVVTYEAADVPVEAPGTPPTNGPFLLYVGTYYPYKNVHTLIAAFARMRRPAELKLLLVGDFGSFERNLRAQIDRLGLVSQVHLVGEVADNRIGWYYRHAAAYVCPSLSEGFGLPGLAAMKQGTPVVSSDSTCLPEVYGSAALYFDPRDADDLAQALEAVLENSELRDKLIRAGRLIADRYSWQRMATETLATYERAMRPPPFGPLRGGPRGA